MQHFLDRFFSFKVELVLCTKFGQSILRKIIKIAATRCHILGLKCNKFDFSWGSAPDPAGEAYSAPPGPLAEFQGPTSKGRAGKGRKAVSYTHLTLPTNREV